MNEPTPFEIFEPGTYLHGTKADLAPGDLLAPGHPCNYETERTLKHVYFAETLAAAAWGAQLALGDRPPRIYVVEPTGEFEDDPNVTDKLFPGNDPFVPQPRTHPRRPRTHGLGRPQPGERAGHA